VKRDEGDEEMTNLNASREGSPKASAGAYSDAAFVQCGGIGHTRELIGKRDEIHR